MLTIEQKESNFREIIRAEAEKTNRFFFEDVENGREVETESIIAWDMFGWLIPRDRVDEFMPFWESGHTEDWEDFLVTEKFEISNGQCTVAFRPI